jgi:hypothetical protein
MRRKGQYEWTNPLRALHLPHYIVRDDPLYIAGFEMQLVPFLAGTIIENRTTVRIFLLTSPNGCAIGIGREQ